MELNRKFLEEAIETLEKSYVTSTIELIKLPVFMKQIKKELKKTEDEKKREQLGQMVANNEMQAKWHKESLENLDMILEKVYLLRK